MLSVVAGGEERRDSVAAGLAALPAACQLVLVHDAARPFASVALIDRIIAGARAGTAVVPGLPVADTIKELQPGTTERVARTVPRHGLRRIQTPQGFPRRILEEAHARAESDGPSATDDAGLVEQAGGTVHIVPGDPRNLKVTTADDLALAEFFSRQEQ